MIHQHATNHHVSVPELVARISKHVQKIAVTAFWTLSLMIQPYKTQVLCRCILSIVELLDNYCKDND